MNKNKAPKKGAELTDDRDETSLITMRLPNKLSARFAVATKRWGVTRTDLFIEGGLIQSDPVLAAAIGDQFGASRLALVAFADLVEEAGAALKFSAAEWNFLAAANSDLPMTAAAAEVVAVNAGGSHRKTNLGGDYLHRDPDTAVASLLRKLKELTPIQRWAVVVAIHFRNSHEIDDGQEWWTPRFRRQTAEG